MAAYTTPIYFRHTFKVSKELKSYKVYELVEVKGSANLLTQIIRIELYVGKSLSTNIQEYLRLRNSKNWNKCEKVTGLRPCGKQGLFYGDRRISETNKTLLIFEFSNNRTHLFIDVYRGYYPSNRGILQSIINTY